MSKIANCNICQKPFELSSKPGRPAVKCEACRAEKKTAPIKTNIVKAAPIIKDVVVISANDPALKAEVVVLAKSKVAKVATGETYCLMVGNMGMAYGGEDEKEAMKQFNHYVKASEQGFGQVGFEAVQLWKRNGENYEMFKDHQPDRSL